MKTKEIDVWVDIKEHGVDSVWFTNPRGKYHPAKLIIEVPEPKIELTPSRLVEKYWECCEVNDPFEITIVKLERALFGDLNE